MILEQSLVTWNLRRRIAETRAATRSALLQEQRTALELRIYDEMAKQPITELMQKHLLSSALSGKEAPPSKAQRPPPKAPPALPLETRDIRPKLHWIGQGQQAGQGVISLGGKYYEVQAGSRIGALEVRAVRDDRIIIQQHGSQQELRMP